MRTKTFEERIEELTIEVLQSDLLGDGNSVEALLSDQSAREVSSRIESDPKYISAISDPESNPAFYNGLLREIRPNGSEYYQALTDNQEAEFPISQEDFEMLQSGQLQLSDEERDRIGALLSKASLKLEEEIRSKVTPDRMRRYLYEKLITKKETDNRSLVWQVL